MARFGRRPRRAEVARAAKRDHVATYADLADDLGVTSEDARILARQAGVDAILQSETDEHSRGESA